MDKKIKERKARVGKGLYWKWEATLEVEFFCQKKVFQQSYNVWGDVGI